MEEGPQDCLSQFINQTIAFFFSLVINDTITFKHNLLVRGSLLVVDD